MIKMFKCLSCGSSFFVPHGSVFTCCQCGQQHDISVVDVTVEEWKNIQQRTNSNYRSQRDKAVMAILMQARDLGFILHPETNQFVLQEIMPGTRDALSRLESLVERNGGETHVLGPSLEWHWTENGATIDLLSRWARTIVRNADFSR